MENSCICDCDYDHLPTLIDNCKISACGIERSIIELSIPIAVLLMQILVTDYAQSAVEDLPISAETGFHKALTQSHFGLVNKAMGQLLPGSHLTFQMSEPCLIDHPSHPACA